MGGKYINVSMTEKELKFLINQIHVDNPFRKNLEAVYEKNTIDLPTKPEVTE